MLLENVNGVWKPSAEVLEESRGSGELISVANDCLSRVGLERGLELSSVVLSMGRVSAH